MFKKVIFSSGIGKLHIVEAAIKLSKGSTIKVILYTSWVPGTVAWKILGLLGFDQLRKRLSARVEAKKSVDKVVGFLLPELLYHVILKQIFSTDYALGVAFKLHGFLSAFHAFFECGEGDILHVRSGAGFFLITIAKLKKSIVFVDHSIANPEWFDQLLKRIPKEYMIEGTLDKDTLLWKQVTKDCLSADALIVNSDFVKKTFSTKNYGDNVFVNYLGIDEYKHVSDFSLIKRKTLNLVFVGHFDVRKGADILIQIMKDLELNGIRAMLDVYGGVSQSGKYILKNLKVPKNINFIGYVEQDEMLKKLSKSDIFIFPTYMEGCARAVMEAMVLGLPVITTKESGAPISSKHDGIIINNNTDIQEWVEAIVFLDNKTHANKIGLKARELIINNYSNKNYVKKLKYIYAKKL